MRFAEIALLLLPFAVFVAWRMLAPTAGPPRILVIGVSVAVVAMAGLLLTLWYEDAAPPNAAYVPARQEDGHITPGRAESSAPAPLEKVGTVQK